MTTKHEGSIHSEQELAMMAIEHADVVELNLSYHSSIPTLTWFQHTFQNLKFLSITRCEVTTLEGIHYLPQLQELYASFNNITQLEPLRSHSHLSVLDLEGNFIQDPSELFVLSSLPSLSSLVLQNNPIATDSLYLDTPRLISLLPLLSILDHRLLSSMEGYSGNPLAAIRARRSKGEVISNPRVRPDNT